MYWKLNFRITMSINYVLLANEKRPVYICNFKKRIQFYFIRYHICDSLQVAIFFYFQFCQKFCVEIIISISIKHKKRQHKNINQLYPWHAVPQPTFCRFFFIVYIFNWCYLVWFSSTFLLNFIPNKRHVRISRI